MNNAEIQIQFPNPGERDKFSLTAIYRDAEGYTRTDRYTQDDIPADQAPVMATAVEAIASMGEEWQASQVWVRLTDVLHFPDDERQPSVVMDGLVLTVEAVNAEGGRQTFTWGDYPEFILLDPAAVAFFKYFTTTNQ